MNERLHALTAGSRLEILRIKNQHVRERILAQERDGESLDDLNPLDVFARCLAAHDVPAAQHDGLRESYREILATLTDEAP